MAQKPLSLFSSSYTPYFIAGAAGIFGILHYLHHRRHSLPSKNHQRHPSTTPTTSTFVRTSTSSSSSSLTVQQKCRLCIASCSELVESIQESRKSTDQGITKTYGISGQDEIYFYEALQRQNIVYDIKAWDDKSIDWTKDYDMVVVRTTWDYSKSEARAYEFRRWLALLSSSKITVFNDPRIISWNLHKDYLHELAQKSGVPSIPTIVVRAGTSKEKVPLLTQIMEEYGWNDIFIKPCIGGGSRACMRIRGNEEGMVERGQEFLYYHVTTNSAVSPPNSIKDTGSGIQPYHHHHPVSLAVATAELPHLQTLHNYSSLPYDSTITTNTAAIISTGSSGSDSTNGSLGIHSTGGLINIGSPSSAAAHAQQLANAASKAIHGESIVSPSTIDPSLPFMENDSHSKVTSAVPCDMMIQPYISSVEELGELSVIIIDGEVSHTIVKLPVQGDFRVQEEFGGINGALQITNNTLTNPTTTTASLSSTSVTNTSLNTQNNQEKQVGTLALRIMEAAKVCVEISEPPLSPHSLDLAQYSTVLPCSLPKDSLLTGRIDFLRLTSAAAERVFRSSSSMSSVSSPMHLHPSRSSLILLEAELIEPCLFFHSDPNGLAADKLALAIARRMGTFT